MKHLPSIILGALLFVCALVSYSDYLEKTRRVQRLEQRMDSTSSNLLRMIELVQERSDLDVLGVNAMQAHLKFNETVVRQLRTLSEGQQELRQQLQERQGAARGR